MKDLPRTPCLICVWGACWKLWSLASAGPITRFSFGRWDAGLCQHEEKENGGQPDKWSVRDWVAYFSLFSAFLTIATCLISYRNSRGKKDFWYCYAVWFRCCSDQHNVFMYIFIYIHFLVQCIFLRGGLLLKVRFCTSVGYKRKNNNYETFPLLYNIYII